MNRRQGIIALVLLVVTVLIDASIIDASPTNAPLSLYHVSPCRILDTRVSLGPLAAGTAMDVHVRGAALLASEGAGQADCDVPPEAQGVVINVTAIQATTGGHLKVNRTGQVVGNYSRLTYRPLENDANELIVELCNIFQAPFPHEPCGLDANGRYSDFQVYNAAPAGSSLHLVIDVVGYFAQPPSETAVAGEVVDINGGLGTDPFIELTLDNGLKIVCTLPWSDHANCDVNIHDIVRAVGHIERFGDEIVIYAHGEVGVIDGTP